MMNPVQVAVPVAARTRPTGPAAALRDAESVVRSRSGMISLSVGVLLVSLASVGQIVELSKDSGALAVLAPDVQARQVLGAAFLLGLFAATACATAVVRDVNSGLYGAAVLRQPRRYPLVLWRAGVAAVVGVVFSVIGTGCAAIVATVAGQAVGVHLPLAAGFLSALGRIGGLTVVVQAVLGSFLGWLLQRSAPAVMTLIVVAARRSMRSRSPRAARASCPSCTAQPPAPGSPRRSAPGRRSSPYPPPSAPGPRSPQRPW